MNIKIKWTFKKETRQWDGASAWVTPTQRQNDVTALHHRLIKELFVNIFWQLFVNFTRKM